jgi:hypothetical protein
MMRYFLCCVLACTTLLAVAQTTPSGTKTVTGTVLLNNLKAPNFSQLVATLASDWYVPTDSLVVTDKTAVFSTPNATVMLAYWDYPVPKNEMEIAAGISWLWKTAETETANHKAQIVISILGDASKTTELYRIFTRVAAAALSQQSTASGVLMNDQYLALSRGFYLEAARNMGRDGTPVYCWMYFGLLQFGEKSAGYTYGLAEFTGYELEIVDSPRTLNDAHAIVMAVAEAGVKAGKIWTAGQQVSLGEGQPVTLQLSAAKYIAEEGLQTMKIE